MLATILAQAGDWVSPTIDWHELAPELVLAIGINHPPVTSGRWA